MRKTLSSCAAIMVAAMLVFPSAILRAASLVTITITPTSIGVFDSNHVIGVTQDAPAGFAYGSLKSDGVAKTDMYIGANALFPSRTVTLGDIQSISYWTKKGTTHAVNLVDWSVILYTQPYSGKLGTALWYGDRIGTEPYFADNMVDPANAWNQWDSNGPTNRLKFYESTSGAPGATFGSYTDPDWATFKTGTNLSGYSYASRELMLVSIQTGSATAAGFTGQVDGIRIELTDGSVGKINLEPHVVVSDMDSCKNNGWLNALNPAGVHFPNQGKCVSFVTTGK